MLTQPHLFGFAPEGETTVSFKFGVASESERLFRSAKLYPAPLLSQVFEANELRSSHDGMRRTLNLAPE